MFSISSFFFYVIVEWGPVVRGSQVGAVCVYFIQLYFSWLPRLCFYGPCSPSGAFVDFQFEGQESLFFSSSQHSSSALAGCFLPQFLQTGASLNFFLCSSHFFLFSLSDCFPGSFFLLLMRDNICFIVSVVLLMRVSICCMCFSVKATISSSVASACQSYLL
jgi:hypothetical protein